MGHEKIPPELEEFQRPRRGRVARLNPSICVQINHPRFLRADKVYHSNLLPESCKRRRVGVERLPDHIEGEREMALNVLGGPVAEVQIEQSLKKGGQLLLLQAPFSRVLRDTIMHIKHTL